MTADPEDLPEPVASVTVREEPQHPDAVRVVLNHPSMLASTRTRSIVMEPETAADLLDGLGDVLDD